MAKFSLFGRDLITTQEWSLPELQYILELAHQMKKKRFNHPLNNCLYKKTFLMLFYNPSLRTRQSFEAAMTDLGGHAQFLEPAKMRVQMRGVRGEIIKDSARVMSRYGHGLGIRCLEDAVEKYGDGNKVLREYAKYASIPVINMADDIYHPCQGLADIMGVEQHLSRVKGKKLLLMWGFGHKIRSWCSVQANLLISSRFGMDVTLAYPEGFDLDPKIIKICEENAKKAGSKFEISHNLRQAAKGADVVYSRNWMSPRFYQIGKEKELALCDQHKDWICDKDLMKLTNNAYFIHPMPVDRGREVTDEVVDSPRCIIYDIAENRLHVQKAILSQVIGGENE